MDKAAFINCVRSLYNIDGYLLPELSLAQQTQFLGDPVGYLLNASDAQADAIMREVAHRQEGRQAALSGSSLPLSTDGNPAKQSARVKKPRPKVDGQREMLLPILGKKPIEEKKSVKASTSRQKAG